jgi:hypothetical protein
VKDLQGVLAAQAAGYGGGSLVYANVHLRPPPRIFAPASKPPDGPDDQSGADPEGWISTGGRWDRPSASAGAR